MIKKIALSISVLAAIPSLSSAALAPSFSCDVHTGYPSRNSSFTFTADMPTAQEAKDMNPLEKIYVLTAELPNLSSPVLSDWEVLATVDDKPIPTKQHYSLQPLRLSCVTAAANPYLIRCDATAGQHVVFKGATDGLLYDFGEDQHEVSISESVRRSVYSPDQIGEITSRDIELVFRGSVVTHQLVRYVSNRGASASDCRLLP